MLRELLFNGTSYHLLNKTLDKAALRQRVIASNIANVGTPGYQRRGVSFDEELQRAMRPGEFELRHTRPEHVPSLGMLEQVEPSVVLVDNGYWNGINNVNAEEEIVELAANQLDFDTAAQFLHDEFAGLQMAIRGGR